VRKGMKLRDSHFPSVLSEASFQRLRPRVTLRGHPDLDRDQPNGRGCIVTITTQDGRALTARVDHPKGHSKRGGVTWEELANKWREGLPECDVDRILDLSTRLEDVEDVTELLDAFTGR
jgi:2-methylcitrate dehydratase PrpD